MTGPTAGYGRRGRACGVARSCMPPGSPSGARCRSACSPRDGGGAPGRRWTGPRKPTRARTRLFRVSPSTGGGRSRRRSSQRWAVTMVCVHTVRRPAQPQDHDTKSRSSASRPAPASALLAALDPGVMVDVHAGAHVVSWVALLCSHHDSCEGRGNSLTCVLRAIRPAGVARYGRADDRLIGSPLDGEASGRADRAAGGVRALRDGGAALGWPGE